MKSLFAKKIVEHSDYVLVSMYGGEAYYYESAKNLKQRCDFLGIEHDIVEVKLDGEENWIDICRKKINTYYKLLKKHKKTVFWVDVDTYLLKKPNIPTSGVDIGIFMRGFNDLSQFDFTKYSRRFEPGYIAFYYTKDTLQFLESIDKLAKYTKDVVGTDDYFLEEGFRKFDKSLRILTFSGSEVARNKNRITKNTIFLHGDSGNVALNKANAVQHGKKEFSNEVRKQVLINEATAMAMSGKRDLAISLYKTAYLIDRADHIIAEKLHRILSKADLEKDWCDRIEAEMLAGVNTMLPFSKYLLVKYYECGDFQKAEKFFENSSVRNDAAFKNFYKSKSYRYGFDRRAEELGVTIEDRVRMFWWEHPHPGNLGDVLSPYIVEKLTGIPPKFVGRREGLLAIGSIIKWASKDSTVWGAGTSTRDISLPPEAKYKAVRGPYTRQAVLNSGGDCPEIYGDPAWILPRVYPKQLIPSRGKTGLILHYIHEAANLPIKPDITNIDIKRVGVGEIEAFMNELFLCERVVSTSLHGVIIANAYGIPAIWATVSGATSNIHGDGIKFKDYLLSIGEDENREPIDLSLFSEITGQSFKDEDFWLPNKPIDVDLLLRSAPFFNDIKKNLIRDGK